MPRESVNYNNYYTQQHTQTGTTRPEPEPKPVPDCLGELPVTEPAAWLVLVPLLVLVPMDVSVSVCLCVSLPDCVYGVFVAFVCWPCCNFLEISVLCAHNARASAKFMRL